VVIIAIKTLREHWLKPGRADSEEPLKAWLEVTERADWSSTADVKDQYRHASFVGNDRVVFNIAGNKYRIVALIIFRTRTIFIRFIGTHHEYDDIDASKI
jgi:mRNA interferase HigB